jgi:hypothetical protein
VALATYGRHRHSAYMVSRMAPLLTVPVDDLCLCKGHSSVVQRVEVMTPRFASSARGSNNIQWVWGVSAVGNRELTRYSVANQPALQ